MLAVSFFIAAIIVLLILPFSTRFFVAISSSIFQVYTFACFGFSPSFALVSAASLTPSLISFRRSFLQLPVLILFGVMALQVISLSWSPDRHFGFTVILYEIPFLIIYLSAFNLAMKDPERLIYYLKIYAVLSLIPLMFIYEFAVDPSLNLMYVQSKLASFLNHPHFLQWYLEGHPLDQWHGKPRGIIFDPNASGCYLGICSLVFFGLGIYCRSTWLKCIAILHWFGIFFTAVVAAMCLAILVPLLGVFSYFYYQNKEMFGVSFRKISFYVITGFVMTSLLIFLGYKPAHDFFMEKLLSRLDLWKLALVTLPDHWMTGLGFGGLENVYANLYEPAPDLPKYRPHNTIIAILAQSGIIAATLAAAFIISVLYSCWRVFAATTDNRQRLFVLFISGAILWMFLHAMGENWGIVSEIHVQPLIATVYGLLMGLYWRSTKGI